MDQILKRLDHITERLDQVQGNQLPVGDLRGYLEKLDTKYECLVNNKLSEINENHLRLLNFVDENTRQIQQGMQLWQSEFSLMEKQALQYTTLEEKLSDVLLTLQNEKMHTRDQLNRTHEGIITRLVELQSKVEARVDNVVPQDNKQKLDSNLSHMLPSINDLVLEIRGKLDDQAQKMNLVRRDMGKAEEYLTEIKRSCNGMDKNLDRKLSQLVDDLTQTTNKHLAEVQNIPALVKSVIRSEMVWLDNQMEAKWDKSQAKTTEMCTLAQELNFTLQDMRNNESTSTAKVATLSNTNLELTVELAKKLDEIQIAIREESEKLDKQISNVHDSALEILKLEQNQPKGSLNEFQTQHKDACVDEEICKTSTEYQKCFLEMKEDLNILGEMIKESLKELKCDASLYQCMTTVVSNLPSVSSNVETLATKLKTLETMMNKLQENFNRDTQVLSQKHTEQIRNVKHSCDDIKDYMDRTKHEIFSMIEKEAHIVRDRFDGPLHSPGHYTLDFYVMDFQSLVSSGKEIMSFPWYINEINTSVRGSVLFCEEGEIKVCMLHGRHPLTVGLKPQVFKQALKLKASICDIKNKELPNRVIGKSTWTPNEWDIGSHIYGGWGHEIGEIDGDELVYQGYGDKEYYGFGAILIRYHVTI